MHQVLKATGISEAIMGDCMLFFPALKSADKQNYVHELFTVLNVATLYFKYWYIGLTNQTTIFQLFLGALRNAVFFPYTYEISSQLL